MAANFAELPNVDFTSWRPQIASWLTCVRRATPCMVNYLLIAAGYRYGASDTHTEFDS